MIQRLLYVGFRFFGGEVWALYSSDNGRLRIGIEPGGLGKYLLVGYLHGIESKRRIEQEIQVNMAYR